MQADDEKRDVPTQTNVRALKVVAPSVPDPEVAERPKHRTFTTEYKARILREAEQCGRNELGALLRREGLYSKTLSKWRKQRDRALEEWGEAHKPGPKPDSQNDRMAQLERENARLQRELKQANTIIEVQKKISEILAIPLNPPESEKND